MALLSLGGTSVSDDWYYLFLSSVAFVGSPDFSDHIVFTITLEPAKLRLKKPFRFYNFLTQNQDFLATVCISWFSFNIMGSPMFRLSRKLKLLKNVLRELSRKNYSGIEKRTALAHDKMLQAQSIMLSSPSTANASSELQAVHEWKSYQPLRWAFFFSDRI